MSDRAGGVMSAKPIRNYAEPVGPKGISNNSVGLGGSNLGCCGTQGKYSAPAVSSSGSPSAGMNHGNSPTQRG